MEWEICVISPEKCTVYRIIKTRRNKGQPSTQRIESGGGFGRSSNAEPRGGVLLFLMQALLNFQECVAMNQYKS